MQLVSFVHARQPGFGIRVKGGLINVGARLGREFSSLGEILRAGALNKLNEMAYLSADLDIASVEMLPPIPHPAKIICVGLNYKSHAAESGNELPQNPSLFLRSVDTLVGSGQPLVKPAVSDQFDYEGELAVVIGLGGRHIPAGAALRHVAGYSCFNDGSVRDFQKHSVTAGKNFPGTGGFGPALATADEIADPQDLNIGTRLNCNEVQSSNTRQMIYSVAEIVAYISRFTELRPGDVIATGTPEGVGSRREPPLWMKAGDWVEVEIAGIGTLSNPIAEERVT
jgi:2-keto-4-pentenoate hydratase/2-oxohepta-3-ene-1,7-dioic acid hydratase in catechol pathway